MKRLLRLFSYTILFSMLATILHAQPVIDLVNYASGFSDPVDIANAGDSRLFIVEQAGIIKIIDSTGSTLATPFLDINIPVAYGGEMGLLGLAFHPDYANNGYFYVNYTNTTSGRVTRIARYSVDPFNPNIANPNSELILLSFTQPYSNHNGGDIAFGPDGYLYIATGDGGSGGDPQNNGQTATTLLGNILRINVDSGATYSIPPDNPFINNPNAADEIWALGLRNPWRIAFDDLTGDLWIADVGQNAIEEVDIIEAGSSGGENFGWRCYEGNSTYNTSGCQPVGNYVPPIFQYTHSLGSSITGGFVYRGTQFPLLYGHYIVVDYSSGEFWTLYEDSLATTGYSAVNQVEDNNGISSFGVDVNGEVYAADLNPGIIYHVVELCQELMPTVMGSFDTLFTSFPSPPTVNITYQWYLNGNVISGANQANYIATVNGTYYVEIISANACTLQSPDLVLSTVGIDESQSDKGILIMPNPVTESATVYFNYNLGIDYMFNIYDISGRLVQSGKLETPGKLEINRNNMLSGQYFVEIVGDRNYRAKFVVK